MHDSADTGSLPDPPSLPSLPSPRGAVILSERAARASEGSAQGRLADLGERGAPDIRYRQAAGLSDESEGHRSQELGELDPESHQEQNLQVVTTSLAAIRRCYAWCARNAQVHDRELRAVCNRTVAPLRAQRRPGDAETATMIEYVTMLVTAPDSDVTHVAKRQRYGIPVVSAIKISVVTNTRRCSSALATYKQEIPSIDPTPTSVYVVAVGAVYVVWIPGRTSPASEFQTYVVMNSKFAVVGSFAG